MNDIVYVIVVFIAALGFTAGVAYLIQKRRKPILKLMGEEVFLSKPRTGRSLWIYRGFVILLVVVTLAGILFQNWTLLWISLGLLVLGFIIGAVLKILFYVRLVLDDIKANQKPGSGS